MWVVSAALFAGVFAGRLVLDAQGNVAYSYPYAVELQWYGYGAALFVLAIWIVSQANTVPRQVIGCAGWALLAIASAVAILTSIPK